MTLPRRSLCGGPLATEHSGCHSAELPTRPVLLLPGWWINKSKPFGNLWILANDTLHTWLPNEPRQITDAEIASLSAELTNYIRNYGK